jgi:predicted ATP-binding protein involved in virulence
MLLKSLTLNNVRAFNYAELNFQPGMNLIVGINGVGKSTILDTLRILLSQALQKLSQSNSKTLNFEFSDMRIEQGSLTAELTFEILNNQFQYLFRHAENQQVTSKGPEKEFIQFVSDVDYRQLTPSEKEISKSIKQSSQKTLAIYFSPRRALANVSTKITAKGKNVAFANSLEPRELRLVEFADWFFAQKGLAQENAPNAQSHLNALEIAVTRFMDTCGNLMAQRNSTFHRDAKGNTTKKSHATFLIEKAGVQLDIRQLSDGERGMLALVLDLARRLSQANPNIEDPLQAEAVVLIDELDLHLHPQWQRTIVQKLTTTFPNCQFIATTHSPLIIGEVAPESIILIAEDGEIIHPDQSLGMDTDWILKNIMVAPTRRIEDTLELKRIAELIKTEDYDEAIDAINILRDQIGEFPELVRLQTRIDRFQMLGE